MSESLNELFIEPVNEAHSEIPGPVLLNHSLMCVLTQALQRPSINGFRLL